MQRSILSVSAAAVAVGFTLQMNKKKTIAKCDNSAFVFIKPHANTNACQKMVTKTLKDRGINIKEEGEIRAEKIDSDMLIDQHYYAIASKATILKPIDMPVPGDKFEKHFKLAWSEALKSGTVYNALDACTYLEIDANQLDAAWAVGTIPCLVLISFHVELLIDFYTSVLCGIPF